MPSSVPSCPSSSMPLLPLSLHHCCLQYILELSTHIQVSSIVLISPTPYCTTAAKNKTSRTIRKITCCFPKKSSNSLMHPTFGQSYTRRWLRSSHQCTALRPYSRCGITAASPEKDPKQHMLAKAYGLDGNRIKYKSLYSRGTMYSVIVLPRLLIQNPHTPMPPFGSFKKDQNRPTFHLVQSGM